MVMLLTKPLTAFLNANRTPQLHTLLLITPTGKLLSSASPQPASILRTQATIASSLYSQYVPIASSGTIQSSLPSQAQSNNGTTSITSTSPQDLTSILIQLDHGTMIIRPLHCALLLVAIGPSPSASFSTSAQTLGHELEYLALTAAASPLHPHPPANNGSSANLHAQQHGYLAVEGEDGMGVGGANGVASSAASDDGSLRSGSVAGTGSLRVLRRQAEELARWLDGELEGFVLAPPL